jgi:cell division protein FtsI (penicillin-binding protein 3)
MKINHPSPSNTLVLRLPMWRSRAVLFFMFIGFFALLGRAFWIQGPGNDFYAEKGKRVNRVLILPSVRGRILDRNGEILATSLEAKTVIAYPETIPDDLPQAKINAFAKLLQMNEADLKKKLNSTKNQLFLKRQVEPDVAAKIKDLGIPGIVMTSEYRRYYPEGEAVAHVVGYTDIDNKGQDGMEAFNNEALSGKDGQKHVVIDRLGRVVDDLGDDEPPRNGRDVQLSIDSKVQSIAYQEIKKAVIDNRAKSGSAIVIDSLTGEVLAMANYPSFNPNQMGNVSLDALRNRVMTDTFEPGSTMKPFTISLSLEKGLINPNTQFQIGHLQIGKKEITDTHPYSILTVSQIIQKSSNIGTTRIALQMEPEDMWGMFQSVGFGQAPKIGFKASVAGTVKPYEKWGKLDQATMSFGYGISTSLFQLARAYTIFARDGELVPVSIVKVDKPPVGTRVISPKTAIEMRSMMELVTQEGGTAPKAQVPGYRVGGKTGTAHKSMGKGGYASNRYDGFFAGVAPITNPRIVVAVVVDDPTAGSHYGGDVAAPVFSAITGPALRALNVPPDSAVKDLVQAPQAFVAQRVNLKQ